MLSALTLNANVTFQIEGRTSNQWPIKTDARTRAVVAQDLEGALASLSEASRTDSLEASSLETTIKRVTL